MMRGVARGNWTVGKQTKDTAEQLAFSKYRSRRKELCLIKGMRLICHSLQIPGYHLLLLFGGMACDSARGDGRGQKMQAVCPHVFFQKRKNNLTWEKCNFSKLLPTLTPKSHELKLLLKKKKHNRTTFQLTSLNLAFYSNYLHEVKPSARKHQKCYDAAKCNVLECRIFQHFSRSQTLIRTIDNSRVVT